MLSSQYAGAVAQRDQVMTESGIEAQRFGWPLLWRLPLLLAYLLLLPLAVLSFVPGVRDLPVGGMKLHMWVHRAWMRGLIAVVGIRLRVSGQLPLPPSLVVANHISWFDIPVLHALWPMGLVAKAEIRDWPLIGRLATIAGSIYIQRGNQHSRQRVNRRMAARLRRGEMIGVFPEGGIREERGIKHFHSRLYGSAIRARAPIVPVAIRYWDGANQHDSVVFARGQNLVANLLGLMSHWRLEAQVMIAEPLTDHLAGRDALARRSQAMVEALYAS